MTPEIARAVYDGIQALRREPVRRTLAARMASADWTAEQLTDY